MRRCTTSGTWLRATDGPMMLPIAAPPVCVGQGAKIAPRAGDDVGQQADVGRGQLEHLQFPPQFEQAGLAHVGEDQVLFV